MSAPPISKSGPKLDPPKDDYNLFVGIFLWIGIGCLMPWNFFINGTIATNISWCNLQQETFNTDCTLLQTSLSSIKHSILCPFIIWKHEGFLLKFSATDYWMYKFRQLTPDNGTTDNLIGMEDGDDNKLSPLQVYSLAPFPWRYVFAVLSVQKIKTRNPWENFAVKFDSVSMPVWWRSWSGTPTSLSPTWSQTCWSSFSTPRADTSFHWLQGSS